MTGTRDAYPSRVTEVEIAAALKAVRYPPVSRTNGMGGASGHYETDHAAHARSIMAAVGAARLSLRGGAR